MVAAFFFPLKFLSSFRISGQMEVRKPRLFLQEQVAFLPLSMSPSQELLPRNHLQKV